MAGTPPPRPSSPAPAKRAAAASAGQVSAQALTIAIPVSTSCFGVGGSDGGSRPTFSQLLAGAMASPAAGSGSPMIAVPVVAVPCFIAPAGLLDSPGITGQFAMTHQAVLATVTAQAQMQLQAGYASPSSNPFPQPVLSPLSPVPIQQRPSLKSEDKVSENKDTAAEPEQRHTSEQKPQSTHVIVKTTSSDGYNWRKYGQKQVKNSESSRSYYRCTQANCLAKKKVECCSDGHVTEICYRGDHNHEPPPQKAKCSKERKSQATAASKEDENLKSPTVEPANLDYHLLKEEENSKSGAAEQLHCSSDCEGNHGISVNEEAADEPEPKKRNIESPIAYSSPSLKTFKEPKVVVQAANDEGPASDGYRWRKYGQKVVKGNPNPRSYYKCTHMGCPVRKHVERACEDAKSIIITYEGKHNHDVPPPRNGNGVSPSALPTADATVTVTSDEKMQESNSLCKAPLTNSVPQEDREVTRERTPETESERKELEPKAIPIAMAYEPKSAEDKGGTHSSDAIQRHLFDGNLQTVPVHNSCV